MESFPVTVPGRASGRWKKAIKCVVGNKRLHPRPESRRRGAEAKRVRKTVAEARGEVAEAMAADGQAEDSWDKEEARSV